MWRNIASNALTLFVVLLVAVGGVIGWGKLQYTAEGPLAEAICVRVEPGSNMSRVSADLAAQGAVSNALIFRMGSDYSEKSSALKAGSFLVPASASMERIVDILTRGGQSTCGTEIVYRIGVNKMAVQVRELDPATNRFVERAMFEPNAEAVQTPEVFTTMRSRADTRYRVALAEGVTSWQVVEGLKAVDVLRGSVAEVPPEGYLAPDSYEISEGDDRGDLLAQMEARQAQRLEEAWRDRADDLPFSTPQEALTMASIIEKETAVAEERRRVASVFENRLNKDMRLQTDPTVIYGVTNGKGILGRGLRQSELRRKTPYNTYVINGLPPTPIANPGLASIQAALNPEKTDFLFFVADGSGGHAFAETLAQHNANVAKWRALEADKPNQ
jgi:UPF0755 protein